MIFAEEHGPDFVLLQVQGEAVDIVRERQQLAGHHLLHAVDLGDAVARLDDRPDFFQRDARLEPFDLLTDDVHDLVGSQLLHRFLPESGVHRRS
ncbi:hypothetical protein HRbin08_02269 [bacterium HR08]|nr:hypothetical protein HRbin08_02269 [bacterium HR08]